jgi:hypothetical protein
LLSSWVARFVMQPTALHCTSTFGDIIWRIRGVSPPSCTISTLFSATTGQTIYRRVEPRSKQRTIHGEIPQRGTGCPLYLDIGAL